MPESKKKARERKRAKAREKRGNGPTTAEVARDIVERLREDRQLVLSTRPTVPPLFIQPSPIPFFPPPLFVPFGMSQAFPPTFFCLAQPTNPMLLPLNGRAVTASSVLEQDATGIKPITELEATASSVAGSSAPGETSLVVDAGDASTTVISDSMSDVEILETKIAGMYRLGCASLFASYFF